MQALNTDRLTLREWKESDSEDLYEYAKNEMVGPRAGWKTHKSQEQSKAIIKSFIKENEVYAIVLNEENKVVGSIGLHKRKPNESLSYLNQREIGYVLNPQYWGREIIPEAVNCLTKFGFEELDLDLIWCGYFDENYNSKKVIDKCGFKFRFSKNDILSLLDNKEVTLFYYCIFRGDYFKNKY